MLRGNRTLSVNKLKADFHKLLEKISIRDYNLVKLKRLIAKMEKIENLWIDLGRRSRRPVLKRTVKRH